ncbi:PQQ-binding-like beta-propeller repeat protein [Telmatocola sphagniphila]|uniref:PQQ-binding-like beta-propeller repeat protein n=1 Tax=Telmatocola sphagniphila TaxID=1123043 RepID=A0A8E6B6G8_9BACT|nr:PQQ-binding-like beta-propeller repeat protein [Telmatocola sphagniphila]QVL32611.1 PQQ-binding-like beta-propeller repeat protein [Telmatocola sphagniphila]
MSITTECPECQSRYFLNRDMLGKKMRCPTCKTVFLIAELVAEKSPPTSDPPSATPSTPPNLPKPAKPDLSPKEFVWSEGQDLHPPSVEDTASSEELTPPPFFIPPKVNVLPPKQKLSPNRILAIVSMLVIIAGGVVAGAVYLKQHLALAPDRLWESAEADFKKKNFEAAKTQFEEFAKSYPTNPKQKEAQFLAELSQLRAQVDSIVTRKDPQPAIDRLMAFLRRTEDKDLKPFTAKDRYGVEIWQAASRLQEDAVDYLTAKLNAETVAAVKKELTNLVPIQTLIGELRPLEVAPDQQAEQAILALNKRIEDLEQRLVFIEDWRKRLEKPDDSSIRKIREEAISRKLENDPEVRKIFTDAESGLQKLFVYEPYKDLTPGKAVPDRKLSGLVFALKAYDDPERRFLEEPKRIFIASTLGLLYGYEAESGELAWVQSIGDPGEWYELRGNTPAEDRHLVVHRTAQENTIELRENQQGKILWSQKLPFRISGSPRVYGEKILFAGKSFDGVAAVAVWEIELRTGTILGAMKLGSARSGEVLVEPTSSSVYWIADGRAAYVFRWPSDVQIKEAPRLIDSIMLDPSDTSTGSQNLIWPISTGENKTPLAIRIQPRGEHRRALRWLKLSNDAKASSDAESPLLIQGSIAIDGDRIALVDETNQMQVRQLAANSSGRESLPIVTQFGFPKEESSNFDSLTWLRFRETDALYYHQGDLWQIRFGFQRTQGVTHSTAKLIGNLGRLERAPWLFGESAILQTATETQKCVLTSIDLQTGKIRWKRQLGCQSPELVNWMNKVWMFDRNGRIYQFDPAKFNDGLTIQSTSFADSIEGLIDVPIRLMSPNGQSLVQVAQIRKAGELMLLIRVLDAEKFEQYAIKLPPAALAATPLLTDQELILPLLDGRLYRSGRANNFALEPGPNWRVGNTSPGNALLARIGADKFAITDGDRQVNIWDSTAFEMIGKFTNPRRILALASISETQILLLDETGEMTTRDSQGSGPATSAGKITLNKNAWQVRVHALPFSSAGKPGWVVIQPDRMDICYLGETKPRASKTFDDSEMILGATLADTDTVQLTLASGQIETIGLSDGNLRSQKPVSYPTAPSSGALFSPNGSYLIPMLDGTVQVIGK